MVEGRYTIQYVIGTLVVVSHDDLSRRINRALS